MTQNTPTTLCKCFPFTCSALPKILSQYCLSPLRFETLVYSSGFKSIGNAAPFISASLKGFSSVAMKVLICIAFRWWAFRLISCLQHFPSTYQSFRAHTHVRNAAT